MSAAKAVGVGALGVRRPSAPTILTERATPSSAQPKCAAEARATRSSSARTRAARSRRARACTSSSASPRSSRAARGVDPRRHAVDRDHLGLSLPAGAGAPGASDDLAPVALGEGDDDDDGAPCQSRASCSTASRRASTRASTCARRCVHGDATGRGEVARRGHLPRRWLGPATRAARSSARRAARALRAASTARPCSPLSNAAALRRARRALPREAAREPAEIGSGRGRVPLRRRRRASSRRPPRPPRRGLRHLIVPPDGADDGAAGRVLEPRAAQTVDRISSSHRTKSAS